MDIKTFFKENQQFFNKADHIVVYFEKFEIFEQYYNISDFINNSVFASWYLMHVIISIHSYDNNIFTVWIEQKD